MTVAPTLNKFGAIFLYKTILTGKMFFLVYTCGTLHWHNFLSTTTHYLGNMYITTNKKLLTLMKKLSLIILLLLPALVKAQQIKADSISNNLYDLPNDTVPKRDIIDELKKVIPVKSTKLPRKGTRKIYYSLVPIPTNIPGGGRALITSTNAAFYLGPRRTTNLSNVSFSPSFSFGGRFSFSFHSNLWLDGNYRNIIGDMRFIINPQYTWGLGNGVPEEQKQLVGNNYFRFYQTFMRKIKPGLLAGLGYHLDWFSAIKIKNNDSLDLPTFVKYQYGTQPGKQSVSSGISLNLLRDSRQNSINPQSGYYANAVLRFNPSFLGSNDNWQSLYFDVRKYYHYGDKRSQNVLAVWGYYWAAIGSKTPYLALPSIGWDPSNRSGRGIDQNRYRGKGLLDLEAEYRRDITEDGLFGFTVFANMNAVSKPNSYWFAGLHPAGGAGFRIKFNKRSNTNIALDYAISKYSKLFYINLGEAF